VTEKTLYHVGGEYRCYLASSFHADDRRDYTWVHDKESGDSLAEGYDQSIGQGWYPEGMGYVVVVIRSLPKFSGTIPYGATINSAKIYLYGEPTAGEGYPTLVIVDAEGLTNRGLETYGDLLSKTTVLGSSSGWDDDGWNEITLNAQGLIYLASNRVNPIFGIRSSDDISSTPPTINGEYDRNILLYYAGNAPVAKLVVSYTLPAPTVATSSASSVFGNSATLNGTLTDDGGEPCDCGFEWGLTTDYGETTGTVEKETGETFAIEITGLNPMLRYYFRAVATNTGGTSYGEGREFKALQTGYRLGQLVGDCANASGNLAVVEDRLHYSDAYQKERCLLGTSIGDVTNDEGNIACVEGRIHYSDGSKKERYIKGIGV